MVRAERRAVSDRRRPRRRPAPRSRRGAGSRRAAAGGRRRAPPAPRSASGTSRRARAGTPARPPAAARSAASWIAASSAGRRGVVGRRRSTPMAPCATAGSISSGSIGTARQLGQAQPVQPGHGQEGRNRHALLQLAQPGLHVAAELDHLQVGPPVQQLRPPAQARGADHRALRQLREAGARRRRDEGVAHILARQVAVEHQPLGLQRSACPSSNAPRCRSRPGQQRLLDLAGEQALAADLLQRPVLHPVAGGLDRRRSRRPPPAGRSAATAGRASHAPAPAPAASRGCRSSAVGRGRAAVIGLS